MASNDEEVDYGAVDTSALNIQPFQFEPLPGMSRKRGRPCIYSTQNGDAHDSEGGDASDVNMERIGNTHW